LSETAVWQVRLSEVRRQIVADWRSSCTEGFVAEVGARPTDEKRTSVSRAKSCWVSVGDEAAVVSQGSWQHVQTTHGGQVATLNLTRFHTFFELIHCPLSTHRQPRKCCVHLTVSIWCRRYLCDVDVQSKHWRVELWWGEDRLATEIPQNITSWSRLQLMSCDRLNANLPSVCLCLFTAAQKWQNKCSFWRNQTLKRWHLLLSSNCELYFQWNLYISWLSIGEIVDFSCCINQSQSTQWWTVFWNLSANRTPPKLLSGAC